jgi:succinoglycan biosynthesis protein ExoM
MEKIVICVCTRGRPILFRACLDSLTSVIHPIGYGVDILVIDNNDAKDVVVSDACRSVGARYRHEPEAGLSAARNAGLTTALVMGADWIAFIDDDEVADRLWLVRFMEALNTYAYAVPASPCVHCGKPHAEPIRLVDAVHGTIRYAYPPESAMWRRRAPWGSWGDVDGKDLDCAGTGNVIFRASIVREHGLRFDAAHNASGQEDTEFFRQFHAVGGRIILSTLAVVTETVTADRLTLAGHWRKAYRNGHYKVAGKHRRRRATRRIVGGVLKIAVSPLLLVGGWTLPMKTALSGLLNISEAAGTLHALCGGVFEYYKKTTGY